jgi:hypothetical protein
MQGGSSQHLHARSEHRHGAPPVHVLKFSRHSVVDAHEPITIGRSTIFFSLNMSRIASRDGRQLKREAFVSA